VSGAFRHASHCSGNANQMTSQIPPVLRNGHQRACLRALSLSAFHAVNSLHASTRCSSLGLWSGWRHLAIALCVTKFTVTIDRALGRPAKFAVCVARLPTV
jgi:hypothetical protein